MLWFGAGFVAAAAAAAAGLVVHPVELQVTAEAAHPAVLVVAHTDSLQLLLTQLNRQLEPEDGHVCMLCMHACM